MREATSREPHRVRRMFGTIARRYDLLNHLLSANLDRGWRREAARALGPGRLERVLDLCGGTGDLSLAVSGLGRTPLVVCCDFSREMLAIAAQKFSRPGLAGRLVPLEADGLCLPFRDGSFDAVTIGFGLRNLADTVQGLREMRRVLGPNGRLVVLEFSRPEGPVVSRLYRLYLERVLPRIGDGIAGGRLEAYRYLARTISAFPPPAALAKMIEDAGFTDCRWSTHTAGIVAVHQAMKGGQP